MRTVRYVLKIVLGVILLAAWPSQSKAQRGVVFGLRGGTSVASASVDIDATFDKSNRTGFAGGVFLDYSGGVLGFQLGAQYAQKGVDLDIGLAASEFSVQYLEIPAVLKLGIPLLMVKPSVFGGVALGFNTQCESNSVDCGDNVKSTEFSGVAGADVALYLGSISLWADGRYNFGLSNISNAPTFFEDLKNRAWTFQAGIGFRLGGGRNN